MKRRIAVLFAAAICLSFGAAQRTEHQSELLEHHEHVTYIAQFKCHAPQPKVIPIHELLADSITDGKAYFPDVTVLYRCQGTGACPSGRPCGPTESYPVHLPFMVTFLEDHEGNKKGSWAIRHHNMINHTECGCVDNHNHVPEDKPVDHRPEILEPEEYLLPDKPVEQPLLRPEETNTVLPQTSAKDTSSEFFWQDFTKPPEINLDTYNLGGYTGFTRALPTEVFNSFRRSCCSD